MFSTHMPAVKIIHRDYFYLGAGAMLIVGLLAAIAMVAGGEVKKAQARDSLLASQKTAAIYCLESMRGAALSNCMRHARADVYNDGAKSTVAANAAGGEVLAGGVGKTPLDNMGMMPVSFKTVR